MEKSIGNHTFNQLKTPTNCIYIYIYRFYRIYHHDRIICIYTYIMEQSIQIAIDARNVPLGTPSLCHARLVGHNRQEGQLWPGGTPVGKEMDHQATFIHFSCES